MAHVLRFERTFPHQQAKVWAAITQASQLRQWFVEILDYDRSELNFTAGEGTELRFVPTLDDLPSGHGVVTQMDPPHLLEYTWDDEILRWELYAEGDGACRLMFSNTVADPDTAAALEAGWQKGLDTLAAMLDARA
jgi:uncharacterized protein YndB with AHSA1/START domain